MNENENAGNWSRSAYMTGAVGGLVVGMLAAHLFVRSARENGVEPPYIKTGEAIKLVVAVITLLRQITALSSEGKKK